MDPSQATFNRGVLLGILIGEGHFGGDRTQAQITLRLHVRHRPLLDWVVDQCPGARLYGPYAHAERHYYQLMIRGNALRNRIVPMLDSLPWEAIDPHTFARYTEMKRRYGLNDVAVTERSA